MYSSRTKHGGAKRGHEERLYHVWNSMKQRCENPNRPNYVWYGAKGISVCDEWQNYLTFKKWAYENGYDDKAPKGGCTLDRIDIIGANIDCMRDWWNAPYQKGGK